MLISLGARSNLTKIGIYGICDDSGDTQRPLRAAKFIITLSIRIFFTFDTFWHILTKFLTWNEIIYYSLCLGNAKEGQQMAFK